MANVCWATESVEYPATFLQAMPRRSRYCLLYTSFTLKGLDKDMLVQILKEPKNAILKQYQKLLALDEVKLDFDEGALEAIAEKAMEKDTGARALRAIIEEFMLDIMYEIPKDDNIGEVTITRAYIEGTGGPLIQLRGQSVPILN